MSWISIDPECGLYHDEFGGTHRYEDTGKTLAEEFPEQYLHCASWAAAILDFTAWLHGQAERLCIRFQTKPKFEYSEYERRKELE